MPRSRAASWRSVVGAIVLVVALGGGIASILRGFVAASKGDDEDDAASIIGAAARVTVKNGIVILTLNAKDQENAGIVTTRPVPAPARVAAVGYGTVVDAAALTDLSSRYSDAESGVRAAEARLAVSRAAFDRAKILHRDQQNISTAELQGAEGSFEVDKAALAGARSRLSTVAASARQAWGNVLGAALIDHAPLMTDLVERHDYLVVVTLPSGETTTAPSGTATTRMNDGPEIRLHFISPATSANPKLQGTTWFYEAPAESGLLPGLNLEVLVAVETAERGLVVPEAAVVWLQGKAWIYLRAGIEGFERREIVPDRPAPDGGYIVTGMSAGAQIVLRGAQMLLSEEFRSQAPIED